MHVFVLTIKFAKSLISKKKCTFYNVLRSWIYSTLKENQRFQFKFKIQIQIVPALLSFKPLNKVFYQKWLILKKIYTFCKRGFFSRNRSIFLLKTALRNKQYLQTSRIFSKYPAIKYLWQIPAKWLVLKNYLYFRQLHGITGNSVS